MTKRKQIEIQEYFINGVYYNEYWNRLDSHLYVNFYTRTGTKLRQVRIHLMKFKDGWKMWDLNCDNLPSNTIKEIQQFIEESGIMDDAKKMIIEEAKKDEENRFLYMSKGLLINN